MVILFLIMNSCNNLLISRLTLVWQYFGTLICELFLEMIRSYAGHLKMALKLRICVTLGAIFNVELVAVLTMAWPYIVRTTMIV